MERTRVVVLDAWTQFVATMKRGENVTISTNLFLAGQPARSPVRPFKDWGLSPLWTVGRFGADESRDAERGCSKTDSQKCC